MRYTIRPLTIDDLKTYRATRLLALQTDKGVFRRPYEVEAAMPESYWIQRLTNPDGTIFGLFHNTILIGITAIVIEEAGHGYLTHSYIKPAYRRQGLSLLFFEKRIAWAKERGLKRLVVNHRETNIASKAAIQKSGFRFTHAEKADWPDGKTENLLNYELMI